MKNYKFLYIDLQLEEFIPFCGIVAEDSLSDAYCSAFDEISAIQELQGGFLRIIDIFEVKHGKEEPYENRQAC